MPADSLRSVDDIPLDQLEQIDALCLDFEAGWKTSVDAPPSLAAYLTNAPANLSQAALFRELLRVELVYRRRAGDVPALNDYQSRFPHLAEVASSVFAESSIPVQFDASTVPPPYDVNTVIQAQPPGDPRSTTPLGVFGNYDLLGVIAQGGMGVVYKARQRGLNRIVALKLTLTGQAASDEERRRFRSEAVAAGKLDHPYIVPIFDVGEHHGQPFFSMGYVDGTSLKQLITEGPLPPRQAAELTKSIAEAVHYAHDQGIIHRDLKPANVLIDRHGQPRITDFGLAKSAAVDSDLTATGQVLGTPAFMPPEQARGDIANVGPTADIYSVGATLYCLLTGRPPFQAATVVATIHQVLNQEPVSPRQLNPEVPRDLETICLKCLHKSHELRYPTSSALADDLGRYLQGFPVHARPISSIQRLTRWASRNRGLAAALGTTVVTLAALAAYQSYASQQIRDALGKEKKQTRIAQEQTQLAQEQTKIAKERGRAEAEQRELADARLEVSQANSYVTTIRLADAKWKEGDVENAAALLDSLRPQPGEKDRRGWEWNYLWNRSHNEVARIDTKGDKSWPAVTPHFSPNGRSLLYCNREGAFLHDVSTGEVTRHWKDDPMPQGMSACAFSRDGRSIFTACWQGPLSCWDAQTGEKRFSVGLGDRRVRKIYTTDNGDEVLTFAWGLPNRLSDRLDTWSAETGELLHTLEQSTPATAGYRHTPPHVSPDGKFVRFAEAQFLERPGDDFEYCHVEIKTGQRVKVQGLLGSMGVYRQDCLSSDGRLFANFHGLNRIQIVDLVAEKLLLTIPLVSEPDFRLDGSRIRLTAAGDRVAAYVQNGIKIWDLSTGAEQLHIRGAAQPRAFDFSPDGRWLVTSDRQGVICLWDAREGSNELRVNAHGWLTFSEDNTKLYCVNPTHAFLDANATQYDARTGEVETQFRVSGQTATNLRVHAFALDGERLLTANNQAQPAEQEGIWWDWQTGRQVLKATIQPFTDSRPLSICLSGDGRYWAYSRTDQPKVEIRDLENGSVVQTIAVDETHRRSRKVFNRTGSRMLLASSNWDVAANKRMCLLAPVPDNRVDVRPSYAAYSPSGERIAVLHTDGITKLSILDGRSGRRLKDINIGQPMQGINRYAFSGDGRRIIGTNLNGGVRLWDIDTGQELLALSAGFHDGTWNDAISPDGTRILGQFAKSNPEMTKFESGSIIWDGRPESEWKTRAAERAARSTVLPVHNPFTNHSLFLLGHK